MDQEKHPGKAKNPADAAPEEGLGGNPEVEDFFRRLKSDGKHPKPGQEGIAAALQAIQRISLETDVDNAVSSIAQSSGGARYCTNCGSQSRSDNRFCPICGVLLESPVAEAQEAPQGEAVDEIEKIEPHAPGQHHYHHHYHHHYFTGSAEAGAAKFAADTRPAPAAPSGGLKRTPTAGAPLSRAETAMRKLTQDWAQACNNKHLDDLVSLYTADANVLRPNVPAIRGAAAIREFFFGVLEAGLGDVEMEPLRVEILGDFAYEAGRCQMLVPVAFNQRREERGKYLVVAARQAGDWKILADCWSSDLSLGVTAEPAKPVTPNTPLLRPPRKNS
jgi:uncharacterized protein (TIGR02246 family)